MAIKKAIRQCLDRLSQQYLLQGVLSSRIKQFESDNANNDVLKDYLSMHNKLSVCQSLIKDYKEDLYQAMEKEKEKSVEDNFISVTCKFPYSRSSFDYEAYFKDHPISDEDKAKYMKETTVKGNVTIKEKRIEVDSFISNFEEKEKENDK